MADENEIAFSALLERIGFDANTRAYIVSQGFTTASIFATLPLSSYDEMLKNITKGPAGVAARQQPHFPYVSTRYLKAFRMWMDYRLLRDEPLDADAYAIGMMAKWVKRVEEINNAETAKKSITATPPNSLKSLDDWESFEELFLTYLRTFRSIIGGMPLTYVLRPIEEVSQEALDTVYDDIDTDLFNTARLNDDVFKTNNAQVYQLLKNVIFDGPGRYITKKYDTSMNGRAAFLDIKRQAEGTAATTTKKAKAYKSIATATYSGTSQRYTFDKYLEAHQKAHVTLAELGEPIAETKKVDDFLKGITDPRLTTYKQIIDSDQSKLNDFEACAQYLKTSVLRTGIRNPDNRHIAAFMMHNQGGNNNDNRQDRNNKRNPTDNNNNNNKNNNRKKSRGNPKRVHSDHYEPNEWSRLTNEEKAEVQRLRSDKKQRNTGRNIGEVTPQPTDAANVATISSITVEPTPTTTAPVVFGALRRNVPQWAPKPPPTINPTDPPSNVTQGPIIPSTPSAMTARIAAIIASPTPLQDVSIKRTKDVPLQSGISEHRRHILALRRQINTLEREYEQIPATDSDTDEERKRRDHEHFQLNEAERTSIRRRIALLEQQIKDDTTSFNAKKD
jgi:hypothetical protein